MNSENKFLSIEHLTVQYVTSEETVYAVNDVSFDLQSGKILGLVGETGAGKTTIAKSILRVLPTPPARIVGGKVVLNGKDLYSLSENEMYDIRGNEVSMIFQDPMTALNPTMRIGRQIAEVIEEHTRCSRKEAEEKAIEMLEKVGIPRDRFGEYPFQFSGGMKQRVVIAIAMACNPELLLADEPTTALDVTIQAQVLDLMRELIHTRKTSMILITHDLGVVAQMCDEVAVIYAGEIVEKGTLEDIFDHPAHPYSIGLFEAVPSLDDNAERLKPIKGMPPDPTRLPEGCHFHPRCPFATEQCREKPVEAREVSAGHFCRCLRAGREE